MESENATQCERLRIALVITELEPGGAEKCLTELAIFLSEQEHRVGVFSLGPAPTGPRSTLVERLKTAGIALQFGNAQGLTHFCRAKNWLRRILLDFNADIVQSMLWHANVVSAIALVGQKTPLVGGIRVAEPKRIRWWVQRRVAGRFSRFVCVSRDVARHCIENERIDSSKLVVIPNGISIPPALQSRPSWSDLGLLENSKVILFVGRLEPQKGVIALLNHADEILAQLADHHLVLIGQGSDERRLREIAGRQTNRDRIHVVGWQANAQQWMSVAELVVLPALYEGMPNVLLEAMAVAKPFVAFAAEGVTELLVSADHCELAINQIVKSADWKAFADGVIRIAMDEQLRNELGLANQGHVTKHFQLKAQLNKYESLYCEIAMRTSTASSRHWH